MGKNHQHEAQIRAAAELVREACLGVPLELRSQYLDLAFPDFPLGGINEGPRPMRGDRRSGAGAYFWSDSVQMRLPAKCSRMPSYEDGWLYKGPDDVVCGRESVFIAADIRWKFEMVNPPKLTVADIDVRVCAYGYADQGLQWRRARSGLGVETVRSTIQLLLERWARLQQRAQRAWKTGPAMMTLHDPADGSERVQPPHGRRSQRGVPLYDTRYEACTTSQLRERGGWHIPDPAAFITRDQLYEEFEMVPY